MQITVADIPITVERKRVKYLRLRVTHTGAVILNVPWLCPLTVAQTFAEAQRDWLVTHYHPVQSHMPTTITLFGNTLAVTHERARRRAVVRDGDTVVVSIRMNDSDAVVQRLLQDWYQAQLADVLAVLIPLWQHTMQTPVVTTWRIRTMRSRWGSCATRSGVLTFATALVHYPHEVIAYVVIHELAHLFHPNHAPPFWQCVAHYCPQWRELRAALRNPIN